MSSKATPIRPWGRRLCAVLLPLLLVLVWWLHDSLAFVQITAPSGDGARWSNSQATLNLRLGCRTAAEGGNLPLYGPCWDDAAEDAAERWNAVEAGFEFHIQSPSQPADPSCGTADGINTVVWADTNCGMAWGDETLAVTQYLGRTYAGTAEFTDTDVLFNPTYSWSTYSGSWRVDVEDLHRVAIHEFGHVLGLGHPDDHGQSVNAIMNSKTTWGPDRLQADDIVGIRSIYGGDIIVVSDDHGDTRQDALEERGDEDYFRLSVLRSGTLTVETTGSIDTRGTLYSASGSFLTSDDDSGSGGNFQIVHQVSAGTYYVKVRGWRILQETGPYTLRVRFTASSGGGSGNRGTLENPGLGAFKSGVGVISGWVCDATRVEVEIAGSRLTAAYGTDRADTRAACGDTDNGFAILVNWNIFGAGSHTARLLVDGTEFARSTFQVTTFGQEVLQGARKTVTVRDFPRTGSIAVLEWEESSQNFVIREVRLTGSQPRLNDLLGTWRFTGHSTYTDTYRLDRVDTSTGTPLIIGTDKYDNPVRAGRLQDIVVSGRRIQDIVPGSAFGSALRYEFALFAPIGALLCDLFLFDKTETNRVEGVHFHIAVQNGECSGDVYDPDPTTGTRTRRSTSSIQEQSTPQATRLEQRKAELESLEESVAQGLSSLENPGQGAFKSGIGVISGWVCDATRVEVEIAGNRLTAAYGTDRADTRAACGDTDNGFAILVNWNIFGAGSHTARLLVDGTEFARSTFQVTTFGQEVLQGARKTVTVRDFPRTGSIAVLEWEESSQNFVIREVRLTGSQPRLNDLLGTWEFEYILGSRSIPFAATYRLSRVDTSTGTPLVMGTDVHDDPVRAGRTQDILPGSTLRYEFALFEPWTSYHCKLFLFDKTGTDRVKGVYFLVDVHNAVQNEECNGYILQSSYHHGDPHPMVGTRTSWSTANIQEQSYSGLQSLEETTTLGLSSPAEADGAAIGGTIDMLSPALD